jgi:hypothetical protein
MVAKVQNGKLVITVDLLEDREVSSSGKTLLIAKDNDKVSINGESVRIQVNAFVKNPEYVA